MPNIRNRWARSALPILQLAILLLPRLLVALKIRSLEKAIAGCRPNAQRWADLASILFLSPPAPGRPLAHVYCLVLVIAVVIITWGRRRRSAGIGLEKDRS